MKPTFEEEAEEVKKGLSDHTFDKVWTSPLTRCVRLANYCGFPEAEREDRIKEVNFGEWEMKSWNELSSDPRSEAWFKDWVNNPTPNGESLQDQYDRVSDFLNELRKSGLQKVCLFAHGGVLTCARVYAGEYPLQDAFKNVLLRGYRKISAGLTKIRHISKGLDAPRHISTTAGVYTKKRSQSFD